MCQAEAEELPVKFCDSGEEGWAKITAGPHPSPLGLCSLCISLQGAWCADRQIDLSTASSDESPTFVDLAAFPATTQLCWRLDPLLSVRNSRRERGGKREYCHPSLVPQPTLSFGRPSSLPLLLPPVPPLYTSPPNRAESVKNLTNGFICCQICADLSFPWTILLDTFHS